jgi:predicted nucleotidyltransferase
VEKPTVTDPILESDSCLAEIVRRLVETFHPIRIYLFGSKARGEGGQDSDYDLMVLVNDEENAPQIRRGKKAYEALRGTGVAADVLVWSLRSFDSRLHLATSLPATIKREGIVIYAA